MIGPGTDDVEIRVVDYLDGSYQGPLRVQVGSFADIAHARALLSQLEMSHYNARIVQADAPGGRRYRVQVGYYQSEAQAEAIASRLGIQLGLDPFLVRDESP
jgi:cell division septation protein DedD